MMTPKEHEEFGNISMWGDSGTDSEQSVAASRRSSRDRWEHPLLNVSHNAPASTKAIQSANRRMSGSHPSPKRSGFTILPRSSAGRALRFAGLRARPADLLVLRPSSANRSPPPPRLTRPTYS